MNQQQRAAVQQALDALEVVWREHKAIDGLRQLLEQPEPVQEHELALYEATQIATWLWKNFYKDTAPQWEVLPDIRGVLSQIDNMVAGLKYDPPSQPAAWVGLTDEDIAEAGQLNVEGPRMLPYAFARAIEAKLKEKNT